MESDLEKKESKKKKKVNKWSSSVEGSSSCPKTLNVDLKCLGTSSGYINQTAESGTSSEYIDQTAAGQLFAKKAGRRQRKMNDDKYHASLRFTVERCEEMLIELQKIKLKCNHSRKYLKQTKRWIQSEEKMMEEHLSQVSSLISNNRSRNQHIQSLFLELLLADVGDMEIKLEHSKKTSIELQKLKLEWEHSRKCQELMDQRMQKQAKMIEEYQSQVSSLISNNESQNQHIRSLFLKLRDVYKEKDELRRGNGEFKKEIEYLKNLKTQQQLVDFSFSDQVT
ncbi:putative leucine-rich repeat-containing protein DDB_G0290503 [Tripterygium wilfordii]|uniref:putative leucine-rich repeat-containing protein DDB_G0290503 n=1 Tax=Tripterygium wilfordii TaxID=458696 RepID=UPI0018F84F2E|nr:putative leucine-rich repeat-containing protein DDB_G0290503 [Tripterygium wilfordii]